MMLRYSLEQSGLADKIDAAVEAVLKQGLRTQDIFVEGTTKVSTSEMGDAVVNALKNQ
jgi:3-isopropylmalate dehydrogenase